jgi:hypothetical protein
VCERRSGDIRSAGDALVFFDGAMSSLGSAPKERQRD